MKKPIINQYERFILVNFPNSFSAAWVNKNIAVMRFRKELGKVFASIIENLNKILIK